METMIPAEFWKMLADHKWAAAAILFLGSGLGASLLARALNAIPLGPWLAFCGAAARAASRVGNMRFSRVLYEPLETWFQNALTKTVETVNENLDADDGAGEKETNMKKSAVVGLMLLGLLLGAGQAQAKPIAVQLGGNTFFLPFQVVNGTQLFSFEEGKGFPGAETVLAQRGRYQLTFGAAPVLGTDVNVPFLAIQHRLNPAFFDTSDNELQFGAWVGKPSHRLEQDKKPRLVWGIKASVPIW